MQIKDVCRRTGLTERAVRFYIEKELLSPEKPGGTAGNTRTFPRKTSAP